MSHPFDDACSNCLTEESSVLVTPHTLQELNPPHVRALYRCPECGHSWFTGWNAEYVLGRQEPAGGAA